MRNRKRKRETERKTMIHKCSIGRVRGREREREPDRQTDRQT